MSLLTNIIGYFAKFKIVEVKNDNTETVITEKIITGSTGSAGTFPIYHSIETSIPQITNSGLISGVLGGRGGHLIYVNDSFNDSVFYNNGIQNQTDNEVPLNLATIEYSYDQPNDEASINIKTLTGTSILIEDDSSDITTKLSGNVITFEPLNAGQLLSTIQTSAMNSGAPTVLSIATKKYVDDNAGSGFTGTVGVSRNIVVAGSTTTSLTDGGVKLDFNGVFQSTTGSISFTVNATDQISLGIQTSAMNSGAPSASAIATKQYVDDSIPAAGIGGTVGNVNRGIPIANGTAGSTLQSSLLTINTAGVIETVQNTGLNTNPQTGTSSLVLSVKQNNTFKAELNGMQSVLDVNISGGLSGVSRKGDVTITTNGEIKLETQSDLNGNITLLPGGTGIAEYNRTPTTNTEIANKAYVDSVTAQNSFNTITATTVSQSANATANNDYFISGAIQSTPTYYTMNLPSYSALSGGDNINMWISVQSGTLYATLRLIPNGTDLILSDGTTYIQENENLSQISGLNRGYKIKLVYSGDANVGWLLESTINKGE